MDWKWEGLPKVRPLCNFQGGSSQGSNHTMAPCEVAHWTPTGWIHPQGIAGVGGSSCRMLSHWT